MDKTFVFVDIDSVEQYFRLLILVEQIFSFEVHGKYSLCHANHACSSILDSTTKSNLATSGAIISKQPIFCLLGLFKAFHTVGIS